MEVYRICQKGYIDDLSGKGSYLYGGRWNSPGVYALYTSTHRSLALLELLMHVPLNVIKENEYYILSIKIPEIQNLISIETFENSMIVGDKILNENQNLGFAVPSIVFEAEKNIIINPMHELSKKMKILNTEKLILDPRLRT
jgi:RES domain-containing protein